MTQKIQGRGEKRTSGSASACSTTSSSSREAADILSSQLAFYFFSVTLHTQKAEGTQSSVTGAQIKKKTRCRRQGLSARVRSKPGRGEEEPSEHFGSCDLSLGSTRTLASTSVFPHAFIYLFIHLASVCLCSVLQADLAVANHPAAESD